MLFPSGRQCLGRTFPVSLESLVSPSPAELSDRSFRLQLYPYLTWNIPHDSDWLALHSLILTNINHSLLRIQTTTRKSTFRQICIEYGLFFYQTATCLIDMLSIVSVCATCEARIRIHLRYLDSCMLSQAISGHHALPPASSFFRPSDCGMAEHFRNYVEYETVGDSLRDTILRIRSLFLLVLLDVPHTESFKVQRYFTVLHCDASTQFRRCCTM